MSQDKEFIDSVIRQLPDDLTITEKQVFIEDQGRLAIALRTALKGDNKIATLKIKSIGPENRSYEAYGFLRDGETTVKGHTMFKRADEMSGDPCGEGDGKYLLDNQQDISFDFRRFAFVTQDWCHEGDSDLVCFVCWGGNEWVRSWHWLDSHWLGRYHVLRRK